MNEHTDLTDLRLRVERLEARVANLAELAESLAGDTTSWWWDDDEPLDLP